MNRPLRIAKLTKYGTLAASTRQRFDQYDPYLRDAGIEFESAPLLKNDYIESLYRGHAPRRTLVLQRYFERLRFLISSSRFDLLWVHCELFPGIPGALEALAAPNKTKIVFDYDDAIFHNYDQSGTFWHKALYREKLGPLLKKADEVFCGNAYLRDYAARFNDRTRYVPTVLDTGTYRPGKDGNKVETGEPVIGWLGSPSTWTGYVVPRLPMLLSVVEDQRARLEVVGAAAVRESHPRLVIHEWHEEEEVQRLQAMDIGIMPLEDAPFARGKCGYKLIQYMACGLPVVASPVGVNAQIVDHGINGFLASSDEEWRTALCTLLADPALRARMGRNGRQKVEAEYSLNVWGPSVADALAGIARGNAG